MTLAAAFPAAAYELSAATNMAAALENRVRLTRELLEETREAVGDTCAVAFRFAVDEMLGGDGMQAAEEGRAVVEMLAELPDLWDVNVCDWANDSATTRFQPQDGYQNDYIAFVKSGDLQTGGRRGPADLPDMMVSMIRKGVVDMIGAARPSIADPFLPNKIAQGRIDDIRECIGCNICVSWPTVWGADPMHPESHAWARNGGAAGIRRSSRRKGTVTPTRLSSGPAPRVWNARCSWRGAAIR